MSAHLPGFCILYLHHCVHVYRSVCLSVRPSVSLWLPHVSGFGHAGTDGQSTRYSSTAGARSWTYICFVLLYRYRMSAPFEETVLCIISQKLSWTTILWISCKSTIMLYSWLTGFKKLCTTTFPYHNCQPRSPAIPDRKPPFNPQWSQTRALELNSVGQHPRS